MLNHILNQWNKFINTYMDLDTKMSKKKSSMLLLLIVIALTAVGLYLNQSPEFLPGTY